MSKQIADVGPLDAKILIVGEAPGEYEEQKGKPFVGPSGKLLRHVLEQAGITYRDCRVTNIINYRPHRNNFNIFYSDSKRNTPTCELLEASMKLQEKIKTLDPNVVICLGSEALRAVTGKRGISDWRGSVIECHGSKIIPTYHPAAVLRNWSFRPILLHDLKRAAKESQTSDLSLPELHLRLAPTFEETMTWLRYYQERAVTTSNPIAFDLETIQTNIIRCVGLAYENKSICIPFYRFHKPEPKLSDFGKKVKVVSSIDASSYWPMEQERAILKSLAELFEHPGVRMVGQNSISFDAPLLEKNFGIVVNNHYMDTMHAWNVLHPGMPKSLNFLTTMTTPFSNYWNEKTTSVDREEWKYNCMDTIVTWYAAQHIEQELDERGLADFYHNHVHRTALAVVRAQEYGVAFDTEAQTERRLRYEQEIQDIVRDLEIIVGHKLNPNSSKQVQKYLYDERKLPVVIKDQKPTSDYDAIKSLMFSFPQEEGLELILKYRHKQKTLSSILSAETVNGTMHTDYDVSGTQSGRLSSRIPLDGRGLNLQNIQNENEARGIESMRDLFIARPGMKLLRADLKQAEAMVVAEILKRIGFPQLWQMYQDPEFDIHKWAAAQIFNVPASDIDHYQRDVGKLANHSGNYMAGPRVLQKKALKDNIPGITYQRAKEILNTRTDSIPGLREWWQEVEWQVRQFGMITTCWGRQCMFIDRINNSVIRSAVSVEPQSTVGDLCNHIFYKLDEVLEFPICPLLQIHDEVVVEYPEDKEDEVIQTVLDVSNVPLYINPDPLVIPMEISVGYNWKDCKDVTF